jgi:hypothetical protein
MECLRGDCTRGWLRRRLADGASGVDTLSVADAPGWFSSICPPACLNQMHRSGSGVFGNVGWVRAVVTDASPARRVKAGQQVV